VKFLIKSLALMLVLIPKIVFALPTAKLTLLVVDDNGFPIEGAKAGIAFNKPHTDGWGVKYTSKRGMTDNHGLYTNDGITEQVLSYAASHPDYYISREKIKFEDVSGMVGFRKWQPWNPTLKVVLKKKQKPIPMYVYFTNVMDIPAKDKTIGYDLIKHDWVAPHGEGRVNDLLFKLNLTDENIPDGSHDLSLTFANPADGIHAFKKDVNSGSEFISLYHAPKEGYDNTLIQREYRESGRRRQASYSRLDGTNYYFRIRCKEDNVDSCLYGHGKIIIN